MSLEVRPFREEDFERVRELRTEAFRRPGAPEAWREGGGRVLADAGRLEAILHFQPAGQCFGGRVVPVAAITSMAVDPLARGRGLGRRLLGEVLRELRTLGVALSVLYPSTLPVYRRAGYELAGSYTRYRAPIRA